MVLGFPRIEDYERHSASHGAIVGRVANRIAGSRFTLDGKIYQLTPSEGPNQLHGGAVGLGRRVWRMEVDSSAGAVQLGYTSPDGEEGYPGAVDFAVTFRLEGPRLVCEMRGVPDRPTPINLANHSYYNLGGGGTVQDHLLWVDAEDYTPTDDALIPSGEIRPVEGTRARLHRRARDRRHPPRRQPRAARGPRHEAAGGPGALPADRDAARARRPRSRGCSSSTPPAMTIGAKGHDGQSYGPYAGLCLEAQHFPDSLAHPDWPSIVRTPEAPYFQRLEVEIARAAD